MYGPTRALAGVSLRFVAGEIAVVEGANGSGKSTLLSLLSLLTMPTAGVVRFGNTVTTKLPIEARRHIGLLSHESMLYGDLSGRENLQLFGSLTVAPSQVTESLARMEKQFSLSKFWNRPCRTYSKGQLQRTSLARALLHRPKLLLLDEPSAGLDPESTEQLWHAVASERDRGAIVVLVTHDGRCAERLSARRVRLVNGQLASKTPGSPSGRTGAA